MDEIKYLFSQSKEIHEHHYYLVGEIGAPDFYTDLLHVLNTAEENDLITIHINSVGGNAFTAIQIMSAISTCKGVVHTTIEGEAASAASIIFLTGHYMSVAPFSLMMCHNWAGLMCGKGHEMIAHLDFNKRNFKALLHKVYSKFLTDEEIAKIEDGADLYFDADEIMQRLKQMEVKDETEAGV